MRVWAVLGVVSALMHSIWEYLHVHLYTGYENMPHMFSSVLPGAIAGDVMYTYAAVGLVMLFKKDRSWFRPVHIHDLLGLSLVGAFIAFEVEYRGLYVHRWVYTDAMPLLPYFHVGLSPVLQMMLLLPLSVYLTSVIFLRSSK